MTGRFSMVSRLLLTAVSLALGQMSPAQSQDAHPQVSSEPFADVTRLMQGFVDDGVLAGVSTLIARDGKIVYFETIGLRDRERNRPMTENTLFRIHSMTKPIAAAALMILYEDGVVGLDDPVDRYIPEFSSLKVYVSGEGETMVTAPATREMTVRDLLTHQSGLTYAFFGPHPVHDLYNANGLGDYGEGKPDYTLAEMMTRLSKMPLRFEPGTQWQYGLSSDVVARIVEVASGQTFPEFLQRRIFAPLQMHDTGYYVPGDALDRLSATYEVGDEGLVLVDDPETSVYGRAPVFAGGGSGLVSSTPDYYAFCQMLLNRGELNGARILEPETVDLMVSDHLYRDRGAKFVPGGGVGLGVGVVVDDTSEGQIVGSKGEFYWGGSSNTYFWVNPDKNLVLIVMAQLRGRGATFADQIRAVVYDVYRAH